MRNAFAARTASIGKLRAWWDDRRRTEPAPGKSGAYSWLEDESRDLRVRVHTNVPEWDLAVHNLQKVLTFS